MNNLISTIMAKSKSGGTRAYIRGKVGADVYSIGKTAKGKKQQVVRSLAETVANPQTQAQMFGRMIMSTVMQNVAMLSPIIDHSFDNVNGRQPNISEFISRNYALIKADAIAHPASGMKFGLNKYQEKGAKGGALVVAAGQVPTPSIITADPSNGAIVIALSEAAHTYGDLKAALGLSNGDYVTGIDMLVDGTLNYIRLYLKENITDATVISASNVGTLFTVEKKGDWEVVFSDTNYKLSLINNESSTAMGTILSKNTSNGWEHNDAVLTPHSVLEYSADVALPTYPTGGADFLNGGDIFG